MYNNSSDLTRIEIRLNKILETYTRAAAVVTSW